MSKKQALQFILRVKEDQTLQIKLAEIKDGGAGLLKVAREAGFEFTTEEMRTAIDAQEKPRIDEMANGALDSVVGGHGGGGGTPPGQLSDEYQSYLQMLGDSSETAQTALSNMLKKLASTQNNIIHHMK